MLRLKLREYVLLTEPIYREKYYIELMKQFSPALRTTVANFQLSHYVANIPFFAFAIQRGCGFEEGAIMPQQALCEGGFIVRILRHYFCFIHSRSGVCRCGEIR